jgi:hypothetical protein
LSFCGVADALISSILRVRRCGLVGLDLLLLRDFDCKYIGIERNLGGIEL